MQRYAIVERGDEASAKLSKKLRKDLDAFLTYDELHPELVISVGGDGTMLRSVHDYIDQLQEVAFVGIHTGTLGFFTDYTIDEANLLVYDIKDKALTVEKRSMIEIEFHEQKFYALNEMRLENSIHSQVIDVFINGEHLETFRGNGLCVSTPSGSTAYNKSIHGAIMAPGPELMQISEIAGINHNAYRSLGSSLILNDSQHVRLETQNYQNAVLCIDLDAFHLEENVTIDVSMSKKYARFASYRQVSFVDRLKKAFL